MCRTSRVRVRVRVKNNETTARGLDKARQTLVQGMEKTDVNHSDSRITTNTL